MTPKIKQQNDKKSKKSTKKSLTTIQPMPPELEKMLVDSYNKYLQSIMGAERKKT